MALANREFEQQIHSNGRNSTALIPAPPIIDAELIEASTQEAQTQVAHYNPYEAIKGHGLRGWLRALHIVTTFALYHLFVFAYHRGWFIGKKAESEEKHLQWQAAWLSRQFLKLGPTFIKIGQAVSTRADLLPLTYSHDLTRLQYRVP